MIRLADIVLLTYTKLRARKIRTFITVLLASMLFGVLISASLIANGLFRGIDSFRKEGLTSRYIVRLFVILILLPRRKNAMNYSFHKKLPSQSDLIWDIPISMIDRRIHSLLTVLSSYLLMTKTVLPLNY